MTDKTKRIILIAAGVLLCAALVVGIVSRLAAVPMPIDPAIPDDTPNTKDPVVNISDPEGKVDSKTDGEQHDPGRDAESSGTEQTIQPDPVKPEYTEDELKDPTKTPDGTPVEGTPEPQDHNDVTPPPEQPSTNTSGGLPGFDNVPNAGANQGGSIDSDGDINTQVGIMG